MQKLFRLNISLSVFGTHRSEVGIQVIREFIQTADPHDH